MTRRVPPVAGLPYAPRICVKVLFLSTEFPPGPGGIGTHAYHVCLQLAKRGWQVQVVSPQDYAERAAIEEFNARAPFAITPLPALNGVGAVVNPVVDPISGEPEFKHTPARVEPFPVEWYGVLYVRDDLSTAPVAPDVTWWTRVRGDGFLRYEIAGRQKLFGRATRTDREAWARAVLKVPTDSHDYLDYDDSAGGVYRAARIENIRLGLSGQPQRGLCIKWAVSSSTVPVSGSP